jgi:hypothetical protein
MSMFKAKLSYDKFLSRTRTCVIPFKFYVRNPEKISMYMQHVLGAATIMFIYWCEVRGDEESLQKVESELKGEGFKSALTFEFPRS